ncbi:MAG: ion transporter [Lachnospiraceae bacterium]|nr:ion transporter [Lachnospiraceae bacterium]
MSSAQTSRPNNSPSAQTSLRHRIFDIIQIGIETDTISRVFDILIVVTILLNITILFLETFDEFAALMPVFHAVEFVTILIFIAEYILRIWTADYLFPSESRWKAAWHFIISFDGIIELLTILPFYYLSGFVAFRMLRVVRIFHLFRINAHYDSFNVIRAVLYKKKNQLLSSVFIIFVLMMASSLCMYSAEHEAQPEAFRNVFSGIWWSVSTLLTVGYGDIYPVTVLGRIMAICIAFLGVGVVAIPTGIISAGFVEQYTDMQSSSDTLGNINLQTVVLDIDSSWLNKSPSEIKSLSDFVTVMVRRDGSNFVPTNSYRAAVSDILIGFTDNTPQ